VAQELVLLILIIVWEIKFIKRQPVLEVVQEMIVERVIPIIILWKIVILVVQKENVRKRDGVGQMMIVNCVIIVLCISGVNQYGNSTVMFVQIMLAQRVTIVMNKKEIIMPALVPGRLGPSSAREALSVVGKMSVTKLRNLQTVAPVAGQMITGVQAIGFKENMKRSGAMTSGGAVYLLLHGKIGNTAVPVIGKINVLATGLRQGM